jgi:Cys-tRNA(Pro) deacylase
MASSKTNAARLLDRLGVAYELRAYAVDEGDLSAETVARKVGLPPAQVFKTLVARGDRTGILLAVVPADAELDGKALARVTGDRRVDTVALREVQPLTGHVRGGVTAIRAPLPGPERVPTPTSDHARGGGGLHRAVTHDRERAVGAFRGHRASQGMRNHDARRS